MSRFDLPTESRFGVLKTDENPVRIQDAKDARENLRNAQDTGDRMAIWTSILAILAVRGAYWATGKKPDWFHNGLMPLLIGLSVGKIISDSRMLTRQRCKNLIREFREGASLEEMRKFNALLYDSEINAADLE